MSRLAAIDVGSNASRLLIVQAKDSSRIRVVDSIRVPVRLGHSVFQTGRLDEESVEACVHALRRFAGAMEDARVDAYRAVVTASARGASNAGDLLSRVRHETGITLDAVDGAEEARLVTLAVKSRISMKGHSLLMDLGGGSLELTELLEERRGFTASLSVGTVRLLEAFLTNGEPVDASQDRLVREYLDRMLTPHRSRLRQQPWDTVIGTGGNLEAAARLFPAAPGGSRGAADEQGSSELPAIDVERAKASLAKLSGMNSAERARKFGLKPDRADVIVPALYIIVAVADMARAQRIIAPGVGLKEGIVTELVQKHFRTWDYAQEQHRLLAAALHLGRRYHFDEAHGKRVSSFACKIFDATDKLHKLEAGDRSMLELAGLLHDIGDFVNPHSHHKHTQYIIENSDMMGLAPEARGLVALIARYHRRATPNARRHAAFRALSSSDRRRVSTLASILRLADALDRSHRGKVRDIHVRVKRSAIVVEVSATDDISLELWTAERKSTMMRDLFDREIKFVSDTSGSEAFDT